VTTRTRLVPIVAIVAATMAAPARAQDPAPTGADARQAAEPSAIESMDRVRAALARSPSKLTLQERQPDFTVHIEKRRPMAEIFDVPAWATDPVGWQPPGIGFDLLSAFRYVAKGVADAKRGHDVRLAQEEVQRSIADYCAALPPNDARPANAQICSTSPASR
jgi:hypothetical protein